MRKERRTLTGAFKAKVALEAIQERKTISQLAQDYELHPNQISSWKKELLANSAKIFDTPNKNMEEEIEKKESILYRQIGQLKVENDWLKKNLNSSSDLNSRKAMLDKNNKQLSLTKQCQLVGLSKSVVYYQAKPEREENVALMNRMDSLHLEKPCYGALRLLAVLRRESYTVGIKRVRSLMKKMSIVPIYPKPNTSKAMPNHKKYPYLLRGRTITRVNEVWSMDITYVKMNRGYMYLTAVIDWHSPSILSWKVSNTMTVEFCKDCLQEAIDKYGQPEIFNTDQGCQFTSTKFTSIWEENSKQEVKISMDGRGRATDNAFIERVWRSVKQEDIYLKNYQDGASLYTGMHNYFADYNTSRPHQSLAYKTPHEIYYQNPTIESKSENLSLIHEPKYTTNLCNQPVQQKGDTTLFVLLS